MQRFCSLALHARIVRARLSELYRATGGPPATVPADQLGAGPHAVLYTESFSRLRSSSSHAWARSGNEQYGPNATDDGRTAASVEASGPFIKRH